MKPIHPNQRLPYSAINDRAPLKMPDNARVVIWPILALEVWDISRPMARMIITPPQGTPMLPIFLIGAGTNMVCVLDSGE